jgi:hypothetical protein
MAKSERKSKWKKKMRALKRVKNTPKELARLNKCIAKGEISITDMEQVANGKCFSLINCKFIKFVFNI